MVNRAFARLRRKSARRAQHGGGFLARLARDTAGNVLALVAAALPPILILVGGGVDMSRAYMAQTSLQNACDAGVLAGRRAQAKSGSWGASEQAKAQKMFDINFQGNSVNASGTTFTPTNPSTGVISATATTTIPTTIMKIFGTNTFTLSTACSAEFQLSNIDVMLALDTTGSMACRPDGSNCNSDSNSKIEGLKSAIRSFYYTIAAAVPSGSSARVRFGFVPYNGTVNLHDLASGASPVISQSYLTSSTTYQTKLYHFDVPVYTGTDGPAVAINTTATKSNNSNCNSWANAAATTGGGPAPTPTTSTTYAKVSYNSGTKICTRKETTTTTTYVVTAYKLSTTTPYSYTQAALDTSSVKTFAAVNLATGVTSSSTVPAAGYTTGYYDMIALGSLAGTTNITKTAFTWDGCVEERSTVNTLFSSYVPPALALDHDVTTAPSDAASSWRPFFDPVVYNRQQSATLNTTSSRSSEYDRQVSGGYHICAPAAMNYTTVDTSAPTTVPGWIETYLATLVADGNTYHDIGMLWAARLANPNGINSTVVNAGNLNSISRHIIFLTDGDMAPNTDLYNSYGIEEWDNRVAPAGSSNATLKTYHNARFLAACQTAKNLGYTVWVIGFGQSLTTEMTTCASGGRAYYASDTTSLQTTFRTIGAQVADLRLKS